MINVGIVGATGYVGGELMRLLSSHPHAKISAVTSQTYKDKPYGDVFENFRHTDLTCCDENDEKLRSCDVIFLALPHGIASKFVTKELLEKTKVIDLGADFRLKDVSVYKEWYDTEHFAENLLPEAVYGLCELKRDKIKSTRLIANPGCYTTCSILSLYPLIREKVIEETGIIVDAKSGVSGAGRSLALGSHYNEVNESIKAYKLASHRHTPEIEQELSVNGKINLTFTPHLVPMNRGILVTAYAKLKNKLSGSSLAEIYNSYYGKEFFVRLTKKGVYPETKWVKGSNFCDIGFTVDERTGTVIVIGALDNLVKGAAGQAVQNMNLMFGLDEKTGLDYVPVFPG